MTRMLVRFAALFALLLVALTPVAAQDWPQKPVTLVVPFPPGGSTDMVVRNLQDVLGRILSQPVVIEDSGSPLSSVLAETGRRALLSCQPFTMLRPEHYDLWKDISVKFSPEELRRD